MIARLLAAAFLAAVLVAVVIQDHTHALPLGLWNEGRDVVAMLSWACLMLASTALGVLGLEAVRGTTLRPASAVKGALVFALLLEGLLWVVDVSLVSRGDDPPLGGPYRELRSRSGEWLFLKKPHPGSPLGFRTAEPHPKTTAARRVLFLGDSYTEGSGRAAACNYPEVAGAVLAERLGRPVAVMNAGVAGYGPVDAVRMLAHLRAEGYEADAIVFGLFLENDFSDNLPGTLRRVVAGVNFRFPESAFLRAFHPLNTRSFRYALFVQRASELARGRGAAARRDAGACQLAPRPLATPVSEGLSRLVVRRFEAHHGPAPRMASGEVERALAKLRRIAGEVPVFLVVFPGRLAADAALARELGVDAPAAEMDQLSRWVDGVWPGALHVAPVLAAGAENFRREDTHLSDLGNLRAGRFVGEALAERLAWGAAVE